jgi:two-component system, sensor histidine kinase and response regulator
VDPKRYHTDEPGSEAAADGGRLNYRQALFVLRMAGVLVIFSDTVWLLIDQTSFPAVWAAILPFHIFNVLLGFGLLMATTYGRLATRWRGVLWLIWSLLFLSSAVITEHTGAAESLATMVFSILICSAMVLDCSHRWLGSLGIIGIASLAWLSIHKPVSPTEWFILMAGVGVSHFGREIVMGDWRKINESRASLENKVAQLQEAERRVRVSEGTLKRLIEYAPDIITISRYSDLRYISVNREFALANFDAERALGRTPWEINLVPDAATLEQLMKKLGEEGMIRNQEMDLRQKDGKLSRYLVSFILVDFHGEKCVVAFGRDITPIKEIERKVRESEAMMRTIIDACPDPISISRLSDNKFIVVNDACSSESGYARDELLGKSAVELALVRSSAENRELMRRLRSDSVVRNMDLKLRCKDGEIRDFLASAALMKLGSEPCLVGFYRNISEIKKTQEELVKAREAALAASRAKSEFLSSMSHEIRTPMNAVLGMADLLAESELTAEQRRFLDVMIANGNLLLELINDILDLAKIESGRLQMEEAEFDLSDLVDKTISTFGTRAHAKGLELIARIEPGVAAHLIGDALRLRQILINLIGNAIKFTDRGQIILSIERDPSSTAAGDLRFSLSDTGIGIPGDKLEMIFSSFTQADSSTTRQYGGTGLGLAIVQRLVGLMGGRIWVESEPGKGSRFWFTARLGVAAKVMKPKPDTLPNLAGLHVLVVDDHAYNRLVLREMVSSRGAKVSEADCGAAALNAISEAGRDGNPYQLVLLDMRMPGMDGLQVAKCIRDQHLSVEPLILMLSSDDLGPQLLRLREARLSAYLVKPITRNELFATIRQVLLSAPTGSAALAKKPGPEQPSGLPPLAILVAEDSPDNRLVVSAYLRHEQCQLEFAENGELAVQKFMTNRYDLVFMDIQMPVLDGFEATLRIREWERRHEMARTPIVALSGSVFEDSVRRIKEAGCDGHLAKPVKKAAIFEVIRQYAAKIPGSGHSAADGSTVADRMSA